MIALYIITAFLALLFLAAIAPVTLSVKYKESLRLSLTALGILLYERPKKKKKIKVSDYSVKSVKKRLKKAEKKKKAPSAPKKQNASGEKATEGKKNLNSLLKLIKELLSSLIPRVWGKIKIKTTRIIITVATDDAAKTALATTAVNGAVLGLITYLENESKLSGLDRSQISVSPDFLSESSSADIEISFSLRVWQIIGILFATALKYVKNKISE